MRAHDGDSFDDEIEVEGRIEQRFLDRVGYPGKADTAPFDPDELDELPF